jgi:hypothetical protein
VADDEVVEVIGVDGEVRAVVPVINGVAEFDTVGAVRNGETIRYRRRVTGIPLAPFTVEDLGDLPRAATPIGPLVEFRVTFGQRYAREAHPVLGREAHPDGWLTVVADDYETARALVVRELGTAWANLYPLGSMTRDEWAKWFPRGEVGRITAGES